MADEKHAKGRLAELKALTHFAAWGCEVAPVLGDNTTCDLVVLYEGRPYRVEVKSAQAPSARRRNPAVTISSNTHRRADGRLPNKPVDLSKFDLLAVYVPTEDDVLVWASSSIEGTKKTFTLTEKRRKLALRSADDLVESSDMGERHLEGLCLCRECAPSKGDHIAFAVTPSLPSVQDREIEW